MDIKYMYVRSNNNKRVLTIAREVFNRGKGTYEVHYSWAMNAPSDPYNKEMGKYIASRRLDKGSLVAFGLVIVDKKQNPASISQRVLEHMLTNEQVPPGAKVMIRKKLKTNAAKRDGDKAR